MFKLSSLFFILDSPIFNITSEVIFILDASTTVGRDNFDKQKEFVKLLTRSLNVAPEKSRAALMTYSTNPFTVIPLGNYSTVQDFKRTLNAISFYGGERRMDRALEEAVDLFKRARPGVQRKVNFIAFSVKLLLLTLITSNNLEILEILDYKTGCCRSVK